MSNLVSIHTADGAVVGSGVVVAHDLVLTCAHVANLALRRRADAKDRPAKEKRISVQFTGAPGVTAMLAVAADADAWSSPGSAAGADICLLELPGDLPLAVSIAEIASSDPEPGAVIQVAGYPADWNKAAKEPQCDYGFPIFLGPSGYHWVLRSDDTSRMAAIATRQRSAGLIYKGFSGGPAYLGRRLIGIVTEVRDPPQDATAFIIPFRYFPSRLAVRNAVAQSVPQQTGTVNGSEPPPVSPVPTFTDARALYRYAFRLLEENKIIHRKFGPDSSTMRRDPFGEGAGIWRLRKTSIVVPNNRMVIDAFRSNRSLISGVVWRTFLEFQEHAEAFERSSFARLDAELVPRFPVVFDEMLRQEISQ